ncbi:MAG: GCN5-related N-acetyltransferase [uncultured bacterium]|nr:MAG: GCN5-related N-acetyltransferase [uncultured bacterium]
MEERIRKMSKNELLIAVDWAKQEGWDPGLNDTDAFWKTDPNGFYALEKDEKMIGSVSGVSYNGKFGFGGFFIIEPEYRNQGLGTKLADYLFKAFSSRLDENASIGIDGVFNMQPTYEKWGFKFSHRNLRMESIARKHNYSSNGKEITVNDFEQILELDKECFGFNRTTFLRAWLSLPDSKSLKFENESGLQGYGVIRKCVTGYKIGPLFACNYEAAEELFKGLTSRVTGEKVYLDIPEINKDAVKLAQKYNMKEMFGCARMYLGNSPKIPYKKIYGVTTFELG